MKILDNSKLRNHSVSVQHLNNSVGLTGGSYISKGTQAEHMCYSLGRNSEDKIAITIFSFLNFVYLI